MRADPTLNMGSPIPRLPQVMVAPNGAKRSRLDHPALPVGLEEITSTALACQEAGAGGLHAHVRDDQGAHVLDVGLYGELLAELHHRAPDLVVQVTTEAVGRYTPQQQRALVQTLRPSFVSIALREMVVGETEHRLRSFYHWAQDAGIGVQHILYAPEEMMQLADYIKTGVIPAQDLEVLFVLGRYTAGQQSNTADLKPFLKLKPQCFEQADWTLCAFGQEETACLVEAVRRGGKARIGFENNLLNRDGSVAVDNAARVRELVAELQRQCLLDPEK